MPCCGCRFHFSIPGFFSLNTPALPAPLHLLAGLLNARGLLLGERLSAIRFAFRLRLMNFRLKQDTSVAALLAQHGQDGKIGQLLWKPLCLAALNTPLEQASAQVFLNVLRDSFRDARSDSDLVLPRIDLSALLPDAAARHILGHGGEIRTGCRIRQVTPAVKGFALHWAEESETFSHVICATAPQHALPLLAALPELAATTELIEKFTYQPIATI